MCFRYHDGFRMHTCIALSLSSHIKIRSNASSKADVNLFTATPVGVPVVPGAYGVVFVVEEVAS